MKLSRTQLQQFIAEAITKSKSVLLEAPETSIVGQEQEGDYTKDPEEYEGEKTKRSLYHLGAQSQQLHDMLADGDDLDPKLRDKISKAAQYVEEVFKAITYDKQNPRGR